jgi:hypothetical protein
MLNLETGRKLPRAAGGYAAAQDAYEGQIWKAHPGIGNVILWCVRRIDVGFHVLILVLAKLRHGRLMHTSACGTFSCPR